jgi:hypothetical protein
VDINTYLGIQIRVLKYRHGGLCFQCRLQSDLVSTGIWIQKAEIKSTAKRTQCKDEICESPWRNNLDPIGYLNFRHFSAF